jgi:hypothetical protein
MACLADPPYSLGDGRNGFMSKAWDNDIAFKPETWTALAQHLLPGAFGMCFASSRGWHRLACAIEDAGLIIHPSIFGWGFSQGFPKATRIDTQIDQRKGFEPEFERKVTRYLREARNLKGLTNTVLADAFGFDSRMAAHWCAEESDSQPMIPRLEHWPKLKQLLDLDDRFDEAITAYEREVIGKHLHPNGQNGGLTMNGGWQKSPDLTAPATPLAQVWAGHRYGLQMLKPALEPLIVWQVPYQGKPVQSITQTGAGALWIDGARLTTSEQLHGSTRRDDLRGGHYGSGHRPNPGDIPDYAQHASGRWPPNFGLCHTHATDALCEASSCPVAALDAQAGERKSGRFVRHQGDAVAPHWRHMEGRHDVQHRGSDASWEASTGHASRFFHVSDWSLDIAERLAQVDPVFYTAKASRAERDAGLSGTIQRRTAAYGEIKVRQCRICHSRRNDGQRSSPIPSCGHDDWEWVNVTDAGSRGGPCYNPHPTVKPLKLTQWLATLLLPPEAYAPRRVLIPFAGVGSEGLGAMLAGWEAIVMIEQNQDYVNIARERLAYWWQQRR